MASYERPGVTVKQVQTSVSPNLAPPSLNACIIGQGYYVVETTDENKVYSSNLFASEEKYNNTSGSTAYLNLPSMATLDTSSVYVDVLSTGDWYHIGSEYWTASSVDNTITISGGLNSTYSLAPATLDGGTIRVGFRAAVSGLNQYFTVESQEAVEDRIGKPTSYNPLAFGLKQALINAGKIVSAYGVLEDTTDEHSNARDALSLQEVYAMAPMTHQNVWSSYASHVDLMSAPSGKKERIVFSNPKWAWYQSDGTTTTTGPLDAQTDKMGTCTGLASRAFGVGKRRVFYVNPDTVYVQETRPIATVKQSFIALGHSLATTYGLYAKFNEKWVWTDGVSSHSYYAGDDIDDTAWSRLMDNTYGYSKQDITVNVPVPGYYFSAALAGKVSGEKPEQGLTNLTVAGDFEYLKYSSDYFTETQLDVLAGGGNWIMWQANKAAPIVSRHQLSTDRSSVERQELSITKSLDFAAKFIRDGVTPYIGKYNVTPAFLKMLRSVITGYGTYLKREGRVNDIKIVKLEQDSVSKDTILVTLDVTVKYPVNYIRITLQF